MTEQGAEMKPQNRTQLREMPYHDTARQARYPIYIFTLEAASTGHILTKPLLSASMVLNRVEDAHSGIQVYMVDDPTIEESKIR